MRNAIDPNASWALILGAFTPFIISVVNNPHYTKRARQAIAVGVSVLVGIIVVVIGGTVLDWTLSLPNILFIIAGIVGASQAFYAVIWKPSGITDKVEVATTPKNTPPENGQYSVASILVTVILVIIVVWLLLRLF